jgi:uncharacterized protein YjbI with pentapeptide repeats
VRRAESSLRPRRSAFSGMAGQFTDCGAMAPRGTKIFAVDFWGKSLGMAPEIQQEIHADNYAENSSGAQSLLELAEILDQHKIWVESGGESGTKADFCGVDLANADLTGVNLQGAHLHKANLRGADLSLANLRGASLVRADLRDANLLGTELRGANLMGANLYGTEGLWVGRLGGTNLFDAILPESISTFDSSTAIAQTTKIARWFYFSLLLISVACWILISMTTDPRLMLNASAIPLPRIGNVLPMTGFYLGGPLLLLLFYLRFHFLLLRLWGNMAALPAVFPDGQTLEKDGAWFLMALVRRHYRWSRDSRSPLSLLETTLSALLAYWVVPATLIFFWARYLVRQDLRGTMLQVLLVTIAMAAATCLPSIVSRVLRQGDLHRAKSKSTLRIVASTLRSTAAIGLVLSLLSYGVIRGIPSDRSIAPEVASTDIRRWASQALQLAGCRPYAELAEAALSPVPARGSLSEEVLAAVPGARLNQMNLRYARAYRAILVNARLWRADLEGAYLSEADLRGANLREAMLHSATLDRVQASHAVMVSADGSGANFSAADLRGADLSYGIFENAIFSNAKLIGASLYAANLRNTHLLRTDLSRADLRDTKFERAVLTRAVLEQTDLSSAKLSEANLTGAQLKGTILLDADLKKTDLRGALLAGAILRGAELVGANLDGADLRGALGLTAEQVCSARNWRGALMDPQFRQEVESRCGPGR